jgi:hypothetical protein
MNHNQDANEEDDVLEMAIQEPMPMDGISDEDELCETDYLDGLCDESCLFILIVTRMNIYLKSHLQAPSLYWMDIYIPIWVQHPPMSL